MVLRSEYLFFCDVQIQERKLAYSSLTYRGQQNIKKQICVATSHTDTACLSLLLPFSLILFKYTFSCCFNFGLSIMST